MHFSRRDWILGSVSTTLLASVAEAQQHAHRAVTASTPVRFEFFTPASAAEVAALAAQVLPSDGTPGATEAGVIYFIDKALMTFERDRQDTYRHGLSELEATRRQLFPASASFAGLDSNQQQQVIRALEHSDFFELVRSHTVLGFLADPSYGGNRGKAGWRHIGFEDRMSWTPPFGAYDAEEQG